MKSAVKSKIILYFGIMLLFIMQNRLQKWYTPFQYIDELFALCLIPIGFFFIIIKKEKIMWLKKNLCFLICTCVFLLCGWGGYLLYHYQPFINAAKDMFVNMKFFMALASSFLLFKEIDSEKLKRWLWPVLQTITTILFLLCVADLFLGIFSTETRGGMRAVKLFYSAYTILVGQCVLLSSMYLWFFREKQKKIIPPIVLLSFVMLSTRRVKAMGAVACIVLVYVFIFYRKKKINKSIMGVAGCFLVGAAAVSIYQFVNYYYIMGIESARAVLTIGAPFIAADHFPFGTGWGTYGSTFSTEPYSPVYGMYRMAGVWGLSPDFHDFVSDTFWPMILGQCGYIGLIAYIGMIIILMKKIFTLKNEKEFLASSMLPMLYLFISSSSESAFANPIAVPFAFWIGLLFAARKTKEQLL